MQSGRSSATFRRNVLPPSSEHKMLLCVKGFAEWLIRRVLDWMIGFIDTLYTVLGTTGNYSAIADIHILQFTVTHALGFSVFTSRIMATDLSQYHCNFKSHMKSSCHRQIPFLPFILNHHRLQSPELDPILDKNSNDLLSPFITLRHGPRRKHSFSIVH
jgi:hypothetical protein